MFHLPSYKGISLGTTADQSACPGFPAATTRQTPADVTKIRKKTLRDLWCDPCQMRCAAATYDPKRDSRTGVLHRIGAVSMLGPENDSIKNASGDQRGRDEFIAELIDHVTLVHDEHAVESLLKTIVNSERTTIVSFVNAHALNICYERVEFLQSLLQSDYLLRDGKGMEMLYKAIGRDPGLNLNGTDLIPRFLPRLRGKKIAVLGTTDPFLEGAAQHLREGGLDVVLKVDGFREPEAYLPLVEAARPDFIILGMGMPKQEFVSVHLKQNLSYPAVIVNGGAILDFWGGKVRRAPLWFRRHGLEWLFRLMMEPRRLFHRYVVGNIKFMLRTRRIQSLSL